MRMQRKTYVNTLDTLPTLVQIQNYIKNRRILVGDNNNIDELETY